MKKKILIFIAGVIVGGIITAAGFLIFGRTARMPRDRMPMDQNGEFEPSENMGKRPKFKNEVFEENVLKNTNTAN